MYHNNKLANSTNKHKTTWSIIKTITNNKKNLNSTSVVEIDGKITIHCQTVAEKFSNYHFSVADSITNNNTVNITMGDLNKINPLNYLYSAFKQSFTNIKMKSTTAGEIERIIKELKSKKSCGCDEITTEILKLAVSPCIQGVTGGMCHTSGECSLC
jgi:hypothetical protein